MNRKTVLKSLVALSCIGLTTKVQSESPQARLISIDVEVKERPEFKQIWKTTTYTFEGDYWCFITHQIDIDTGNETKLDIWGPENWTRASKHFEYVHINQNLDENTKLDLKYVDGRGNVLDFNNDPVLIPIRDFMQKEIKNLDKFRIHLAPARF